MVAEQDTTTTKTYTIDFTTASANFQVGSDIYGTLAEAIDAVQSGGTITMLQNVTLSRQSITVGVNHTLVIPAGKTLTISGGGKINLGSNTLTVNGCGTVASAKTNDDVRAGSGSTLNLENTTRYGLHPKTVNVGNGATISLDSAAYKAIRLESDYTLNVNIGGKIGIKNFTDRGIFNYGTIYINGGTVIAPADCCRLWVAGVINGKLGNLFDPQGPATRAKVSTVFANF